jgi:hypothetical protein
VLPVGAGLAEVDLAGLRVSKADTHHAQKDTAQEMWYQLHRT